jgi:transglutaminase/protease-like cytokinesis protein 3
LNDTWYDTDPSRVTGVTVSPVTKTLASFGATQQLTATITPSYALNKNVTWSSSNSGVATVNSNGMVTAVASGSATIKVTTADGGKTASSVITVNINTGINEINSGKSAFEIYPNPASDYAFIDCNLEMVSEVIITVYNINGAIVKSENQILNAGEHRLKMNIDKLNPGIYFVRFTSNNFVITKKMIVK